MLCHEVRGVLLPEDFLVYDPPGDLYLPHPKALRVKVPHVTDARALRDAERRGAIAIQLAFQVETQVTSVCGTLR